MVMIVLVNTSAIRQTPIPTTDYNRDPADPHSDNWKWSEGSLDYRQINGTENSKKDASGYIPDTEDLNRNYVVDLLNDYYTIDFSLDENIDNDYIAGRTKYWKLYRIPLSEFKKVLSDGDVSWQTIEACRLWMDGVAREDTVMIAKIEMVGNEWEELGVAPEEGGDYIKKENAFAVSVINSEDNPDTYKAPKGVQGEYDRINEIRMKEQSLVLWFDGSEGIKPGEVAAAGRGKFYYI
jgi:cell surface protein SprA